MNLGGFAVRNLRRRPLRTTLSIAGIALAVGSVIALLALSRSIEESTRESLDERGADFVITQRGSSELFGGVLPENLAPRLSAVPGVTRVTGELILFAPSEGGRHLLTTGWAEDSYFWKRLPLREGRLPASGERRVALLGDAVAELLAKGVGDHVDVFGEKFRIIGITKYQSLVNRGLVIVPLPDLQELTFRERQITAFHIGIARGTGTPEIERIKQQISSLDRVTINMTSEMLRDDRHFAVLNAVSLSISIIALTMGVMNVLNTLLMATQERTREIGIIAAIGWTDSRIMTSIVIEGLIMCAFGCLFGVMLGFLAPLLFSTIPTIGNYLNFTPTVRLILPTIGAAVLLCTVGSLYPAWRAIRMTPAEALQRA